MSCIASCLTVAAFAAYLVASVAHDEAVTWVAVAVSIAALAPRDAGSLLRTACWQ
ncbi:MAG: hypothetical protein M0Z40_12090 [Actinomycetota bacterium]|nr:hypothetical protein [Actinomycetota bacterium]MDA8075947.1 hypothetical protein [Actinomycetota bacterium]